MAPAAGLQHSVLFTRLERFLEGTVVRRPRGRLARVLAAGILASLLGCAVLMAATGPLLPIDLFFAPILAACFFFRLPGLLSILPALVLFHAVSSSIDHLPVSGLLARDAVELVEWLVLAAFTLVTLDKYARLKRQEARLDRDIAMARTLQTALAPPDYDYGRVRILGRIRQTQNIGGDFYYFRPFQEKYVVFCLGDTMGKGISASMVMAIIMGFFFEWGKRSPSPAMVMGKLNRRLLRLWSGETTWFATLFYGVFDEESGNLTFASGGHQDALLLGADGTVEPLSAEGIPLGIFDDANWEESRRQLREGDRVVLFTDGLTEARSPGGMLLSMDRVIQLLQKMAGARSEDLLRALEAAVMEHTAGELTDDLAMLILEVKANATWEPGQKPLRSS